MFGDFTNPELTLNTDNSGDGGDIDLHPDRRHRRRSATARSGSSRRRLAAAAVSSTASSPETPAAPARPDRFRFDHRRIGPDRRRRFERDPDAEHRRRHRRRHRLHARPATSSPGRQFDRHHRAEPRRHRRLGRRRTSWRRPAPAPPATLTFDISGSILTQGDGSHGALLQTHRRRRCRQHRLYAGRRRRDQGRRRDRHHRAEARRRRRLYRRQFRQLPAAPATPGRSPSTSPARSRPRATIRTACCCRASAIDSGDIDYTQAGNVITQGDNSIGIIAQTISWHRRLRRRRIQRRLAAAARRGRSRST